MENDLSNKFDQYQILNKDIDDIMNFYYKLYKIIFIFYLFQLKQTRKVKILPYNMHFQVMLHQLYRQYVLYNIGAYAYSPYFHHIFHLNIFEIII